MEVELFTSSSNLVMGWLFSLAFTLVAATLVGVFPNRLEPLRRSAVGLLILPGAVVALTYAFRGFGVLERPLVHWVFEKGAQDALHLGVVFDPISFAVATFAGAAIVAIGLRNRSSIRMSAALALSWLGLGLAATSQTLWMATLGIGIQLLSRTFPLIEAGATVEGDDGRWIASTKRAWIGLLSVLCGGAGLAAQGVRLDFFSENAWAALEATPNMLVAGGLLVFGLLVMAAPAFASNALFEPLEGNVDENAFVSETSLSWIATVIVFRVFGELHDASWLLAIGVGAAVVTAASLLALTFQTSRKGAIQLWLSTIPIATLMILPFVPAREATLYFLGSLLSFSGLSIALDHRKSKIEIAAAAIFLLGALGFVGFSTSAGLTSFFAKFETDPFLRAPVFVLFLLFGAFGWRLAVRGDDRGPDPKFATAKWIALGLLFVVGFGPILSGRFSGGSVPGEPDWIDGAKGWAWMKAGLLEAGDPEWLGFGVGQGLGLVAALLGIFAWRSSELFPFASKYPRGARAARGLFGLLWIQDGIGGILRRAGALWAEKISAPIWEEWLPRVVDGVLRGLRAAGTFVETATDSLTSTGYGRLFAPAAKLVQWLHGGNVRLYAWFALIWILIFSVYLTR